jgi:hypothetical protein
MDGDEGKVKTVDMLDYRIHYAVMAAEDRVRSLHRERRLELQARRDRRMPEPRVEGRRRP